MKPLSVSYNKRSNIWTAQQDWCDVLPDGTMFAIRAGDKSDLSSVPRPFWKLIAPHDLGIEPPFIHDLIYQRRGCLYGRAFTRLETDQLFKAMMREYGVEEWRVQAAYAAVRAWGWKPWSRGIPFHGHLATLVLHDFEA
jgi:hypothetical protein